MFAGCKNIININFKNFNTENIMNMKYMFSGCINIKNLDLSKFNTENVINMEGMFGEYDNSSSLDLSSFALIKNIEELENFNSKKKVYLNGCEKLENLNINSFNTKNVTNMMSMFGYCNNLQNLNLPFSFNTQNITNMDGIFYGCKYFNNFNLIFYGCKYFNNFNLSSFHIINKDIMLKEIYQMKNKK